MHTSLAFLHCSTLASTLYLLLLRLLARDYEACSRLTETCTLDVDFTPEEQWVAAQLGRAEHDCHPDAHACRLKLLLAVMYSDNALPWEAHLEMTSYLLKLEHVSAGCRLSAEEELTALYQWSRHAGAGRGRGTRAQAGGLGFGEHQHAHACAPPSVGSCAARR